MDRFRAKARARELTVPLSLDDCKQRLEAYHEPPAPVILFPTQRTVVWIAEWDQTTYGFVLERRSKSSLVWNDASLATINGFFQAVDSDHTFILYEKRISLLAWLPLLMTGLLAMIALPLLCLDDDPCSFKGIIIGCAMMAGVGGIGTFFWHAQAHDQMRNLEKVFKKAFGIKPWKDI